MADSSLQRQHEKPTIIQYDFFTIDWEGAGQQMGLHDMLELGATYFSIRECTEEERASGPHQGTKARWIVRATRPKSFVPGVDFVVRFVRKDPRTNTRYITMEPRCLHEFFFQVSNDDKKTPEENERLTREHHLAMKRLLQKVDTEGVSRDEGARAFVNYILAIQHRLRAAGRQGLAGWSDTSHYDPTALDRLLNESDTGVATLVYLLEGFTSFHNITTAIHTFIGMGPEHGLWSDKKVVNEIIKVPEGVCANHEALEDARHMGWQVVWIKTKGDYVIEWI